MACCASRNKRLESVSAATPLISRLRTANHVIRAASDFARANESRNPGPHRLLPAFARPSPEIHFKGGVVHSISRPSRPKCLTRSKPQSRGLILASDNTLRVRPLIVRMRASSLRSDYPRKLVRSNFGEQDRTEFRERLSDRWRSSKM